jgi:DNA-binding IscR family transcriptional regulator
LRNGGVLKSKRGVEGGYSLAKPADDVTLGEVIRLLDGPLAPIPCVSATAYEACSCPDEASCGLHIAMKQVRDAIATILDNYKLSRVIQEVAKHRVANKKFVQQGIQVGSPNFITFGQKVNVIGPESLPVIADWRHEGSEVEIENVLVVGESPGDLIDGGGLGGIAPVRENGHQDDFGERVHRAAFIENGPGSRGDVLGRILHVVNAGEQDNDLGREILDVLVVHAVKNMFRTIGTDADVEDIFIAIVFIPNGGAHPKHGGGRLFDKILGDGIADEQDIDLLALGGGDAIFTLLQPAMLARDGVIGGNGGGRIGDGA